ncbi:MAG: KTSC domain-containing protein, partial [Chloroflexi bacterium]|nr:KTSC domain-containing protein [Chloroflexota bacterium]
MNLTPVQSNWIDSVGYDAHSQSLAVRFSSGKMRTYHDVPLDEYMGLLKAGSITDYMRTNI